MTEMIWETLTLFSENENASYIDRRSLGNSLGKNRIHIRIIFDFTHINGMSMIPTDHINSNDYDQI